MLVLLNAQFVLLGVLPVQFWFILSLRYRSCPEHRFHLFFNVAAAPFFFVFPPPLQAILNLFELSMSGARPSFSIPPFPLFFSLPSPQPPPESNFSESSTFYHLPFLVRLFPFPLRPPSHFRNSRSREFPTVGRRFYSSLLFPRPPLPYSFPFFLARSDSAASPVFGGFFLFGSFSLLPGDLY